MNIIKLKDIIKPGDDLFNKHLKGKYAFWVHMRYVVSFDHMSVSEYISSEIDIDYLLKNFEDKYIDTCLCNDGNCDFITYIDQAETDKINSIADFIIKNKFTTDDDITTDEVKKFRTWLATTLLSFDQTLDGEQMFIKYDRDTTNMLIYYKNGMIDDTITNLTNMTAYNDIITTKVSYCGCCDSTNNDLNILLKNIDNYCDPVAMYKHYIYNKMVMVFSDIEFWSQFPTEFIYEFKKYIDNIINLNLKLYKDKYIPNLVDCSDLPNKNDEQIQNMYILKKLSNSLEYIYNNDISSHKNYIEVALHEWSSLLYEMMEW